VFIKGKLSLRENEPKLISEEVLETDTVKTKYTNGILINLSTPGLDDYVLDNLKGLLMKHPGKVPVSINFIEPSGKRTRILLARDFAVKADEGLGR
jgi:hypothetical protein